jgi:hypothetical protein
MYTIPAWVILCCEMDEATHASIITEVDIWELAEHPLHLQDPPQGFHGPDHVLRWRSCGLHSGLTVFGKQTYVESLIAGEVWPQEKTKKGQIIQSPDALQNQVSHNGVNRDEHCRGCRALAPRGSEEGLRYTQTILR